MPGCPSRTRIKPWRGYVAPQNDLQEIAQIWQDVLEISRIGINDNFFRLGGDSLNAMVVTKIGHGVTFADLYQNPTVEAWVKPSRRNRWKARLGCWTSVHRNFQ